jgi:hypothetical protein
MEYRGGATEDSKKKNRRGGLAAVHAQGSSETQPHKHTDIFTPTIFFV